MRSACGEGSKISKPFRASGAPPKDSVRAAGQEVLHARKMIVSSRRLSVYRILSSESKEAVDSPVVTADDEGAQRGGFSGRGTSCHRDDGDAQFMMTCLSEKRWAQRRSTLRRPLSSEALERVTTSILAPDLHPAQTTEPDRRHDWPSMKNLARRAAAQERSLPESALAGSEGAPEASLDLLDRRCRSRIWLSRSL